MFDSPQTGEVVFPDAVVLNPAAAGPDPFAPVAPVAAATEPDRCLVMFVFASALQEFPRTHVLPLLQEWHSRSGESVRIVFPGYLRTAGEHAPSGPIDLDRVFSRESFAAAVEAFEEESSWRYGGRTTAVLCSAHLTPRPGTTNAFDFASLIEFELERALDGNLLTSPEEFFAAVFDRAQRHQGPISRRGLGDVLGVATLGTLLVDALCEDLQFSAPEDGAGLLDYFRIRRRPRG